MYQHVNTTDVQTAAILNNLMMHKNSQNQLKRSSSLKLPKLQHTRQRSNLMSGGLVSQELLSSQIQMLAHPGIAQVKTKGITEKASVVPARTGRVLSTSKLTALKGLNQQTPVNIQPQKLRTTTEPTKTLKTIPSSSNKAIPSLPISANSKLLNLIRNLDPLEVRSIRESTQLQDLETVMVQTMSQFIDQIAVSFKRWVGAYIRILVDDAYEEFSTRKISEVDMKVKLSYLLIDQLVQVIQMGGIIIGRMEKGTTFFHDRHRLVEAFNDQSQKTIEYLISKYPPSLKKKVDYDFATSIQEINVTQHPRFNMLANAGVVFTHGPQKADYSHEVKGWFNTIISEMRKEAPRFFEVMKGIFQASGGIRYAMSTKISNEVPLFSADQLQRPGVDVGNYPDLLRVFIKWTQDLLELCENPERRIVQNRHGFKSIFGDTIIDLSQKRKRELAQHLKNLYSSVIASEYTHESKFCYTITLDIISIRGQLFDGHDNLYKRQVALSQIASDFSNCHANFTLHMFNFVVKAIFDLLREYAGRVQRGIDLLSFNCMDLIRCRCVGTKAEVLRVYHALLSNKEHFEVVRVKNKLHEVTRDVLVNVKLRHSFLVCEVQLALGDAKEQPGDLFCHFLYQLERSRFISVFDAAIIVQTLDPKTKYFRSLKDIQYKGHPKFTLYYMNGMKLLDHQYNCGCDHIRTPMQAYLNDIPFICSFCKAFYSAYTFSIRHLRCNICMSSICGPCMVKHGKADTEFIRTLILRRSPLTFFEDFFEQPFFDVGFSGLKALTKKVEEALRSRNYVLVIVNDCSRFTARIMKQGLQKPTDAFSTYPSVPKAIPFDSPLNCYAIALPHNVQTRTLASLRDYQKYQVNGRWFELQQSLETAQIKSVKCIVNEKSHRVFILDVEQSTDLIEQLQRRVIVDGIINKYNESQADHLDLTYKLLRDVSLLNGIRNKPSLVILQLECNSLENLKGLEQFPNLNRLVLRDNKVTDISPIRSLHFLLILTLKSNKLSGQLGMMSLYQVEYLDLSYNELESVNSLGATAFSKLGELVLTHNNLLSIPCLSSFTLQLLDFSINSIQNLHEFSKSQLPKLRQIIGNHNQLTHFPLLKFESLAIVNLAENRLSDITNLSNCSLPNLELLDLSLNRISGGIPIVDFPKLNKINFYKNWITSIGKLSDWNTPNLKELNLESNRMTGKLPKMSFPKLNKLLLGFNGLTGIECLCISDLGSLEVIDLQSNRIGGALLPLKLCHLKTLDLSCNKIVQIDALSNSNLPSLEILNLQNNRISGQLPRLFMAELKVLRLENNCLIAVSQGFMEELDRMEHLSKICVAGNPDSIEISVLEFAKGTQARKFNTQKEEEDIRQWEVQREFL